MKMRTGAETLIFWGAGATAAAGFKTTVEQVKSIRQLVGESAGDTLTRRIAMVKIFHNDWKPLLADLLLVLGDDAEDIYIISPEARAAMSRHWNDPSPEALEARVHELRAIFDWAALKEVVRICPGFRTEDRLKLQDVFNVIDLHAQSYHGFLAQEKNFLSPARLIAARRALQLILNTLFYIDWHGALNGNRKEMGKHLEFARLLAKHHQDRGLELASQRTHFDTRDFYLGDIAFCSLNYDPLALWAQFIANKDANNNNPPHIDSPCVPLKIFHDFGIFMAVSTIDGNKRDEAEAKERVWYPLNEASAQRLNDRDHATGRRVRINKFLFPHGCLCWRECPSCGKLSAYMGKEWNMYTPELIPPPPLRGFAELAKIPETLKAETPKEQDAWDQGKVDARSCVHCGELTFSQHTQAIMQSNFKAAPPSFIEEVQRDLRVATQAANHIILMGYSLPPDDVAYHAFFAARQQRRGQDEPGSPVVCSVVVGYGFDDRWYVPDEINSLLESMKPCETPRTTLESARDIFGAENVRFYGGGIPKVFCDGDIVTESRFNRLINWDSTK